MTDTIFALASGRGRAGVAVVRLSGPAAGPALEALTGRPLPAPRRAVLNTLTAPESGEWLDRALVLWFPGPKSFTGEDCAELQLHGGRAIIEGVLAALGGIPGCRMAQAGEFTRRALFNDRMDLTQVEALADLIAADTAAQRRQALRQLDGHLARLYDGWAERLLKAGAYLEAAIDFAEEEIPDDLDEEVRRSVEGMAEELRRHLLDDRRGERLRDGLSIAVLGAPNVGKSSFINMLAKRDVAIVSDIAGTTRDVLDVPLDLGGFPVTVHDTAGLRETEEAIEAEGIRRARKAAERADLHLVLIDAASWPDVSRETEALLDDRSILVVNKVDRLPDHPAERDGVFFISALTGEGLDRLLSHLIDRLAAEFDRPGVDAPLLTRARHREALIECLASLERFLAAAGPLDLAAEDLRLAVRALGRITGRVDVEDFLDVIFRDFCIGK